MAVIDWWNEPLTLVVIFFALCLLLLTWSIACVACRACHSSGTFFSLWHTHIHLSLFFSLLKKIQKIFNKITPKKLVWRKCGWGQVCYAMGFRPLTLMVDPTSLKRPPALLSKLYLNVCPLSGSEVVSVPTTVSWLLFSATRCGLSCVRKTESNQSWHLLLVKHTLKVFEHMFDVEAAE